MALPNASATAAAKIPIEITMTSPMVAAIEIPITGNNTKTINAAIAMVPMNTAMAKPYFTMGLVHSLSLIMIRSDIAFAFIILMPAQLTFAQTGDTIELSTWRDQ
jgi:predicted secreted protein